MPQLTALFRHQGQWDRERSTERATDKTPRPILCAQTVCNNLQRLRCMQYSASELHAIIYSASELHTYVCCDLQRAARGKDCSHCNSFVIFGIYIFCVVNVLAQVDGDHWTPLQTTVKQLESTDQDVELHCTGDCCTDQHWSMKIAAFRVRAESQG